MSQVIAVVSGKGGTGKTSFTTLTGMALAQLGKKTLLLDDVWIEDNLIGAKMYTIFKLGISSQSTAFLL